MKSRLYPAVFLFGLSFAGTMRGEPVRFHLDLARHDPKAGDEADRTIQIASTTSDTTSTQQRQTVTNSYQFLELKGREKILTWDVSSDLSKVEMVVEHFVNGNDSRTNELLKSGTRLVGSSVLGVAFFRSEEQPLSGEAYRQLSEAYNIRPHNFNEFAHTKMPQSVSIGETWEIAAPTNSEAISVLGVSLTNGVKATGQFVGTTNLFGFDCFHLQFRITSTETPKFVHEIIETRLPVKMDVQLTLTVDLTVPFDASQRILVESCFVDYSVSDEMVIDGKKVRSSQVRTTTKIASESRPISHQ
jgi:hypothetical protein